MNAAEAWLDALPLECARKTQPCECGPCQAAGVTRPPVELRRTNRAPRRWLHGRELALFHEAEDLARTRRQDIFARLRQDVQAQTGNTPIRGSEIGPPRPRHGVDTEPSTAGS